MNPTLIIHPPRKRPWWTGVAMVRNRMESLRRGWCPIHRVERIGLDRVAIAYTIASEWPEPIHWGK